MDMKAMKKIATLGLGMTTALLMAQGAYAAQDAAAKRAELRKMCDGALATLYKAKPAAKAEIAKAAGYGCFTSFGMSFFVGGAGGSGLVHNNASKKDVYMKMGQASGGFDFGIKEYQEVLVFRSAQAMQTFIDKGWEMTGTATAAAASGGQGAQATTQEMGTEQIVVYPMTKNGLAVGVSLAGRKYWKDDELNAAK
jgi:lipid-binding SYLF domain-containing protein